MLNTAVERIHVVAGLVFDGLGHVLISQRIDNSLNHGKWEFPGGKIRAHESKQDALQRELCEEIGIKVRESYPLMSFPFDYQDRAVMLNFFVVVDYEGQPQSCENQPIKWVDQLNISSSEMLLANRIVVERLRKGDLP